MKKPPVIPKDRRMQPSEDYEFLRSEGVKYVEQLASDIWTDYNVHDPGITLLEAISFAITDLGYRTRFEVHDLLAPPGGGPAEAKAPIFTAREILSSHPWTVTDFRKLLVDTDGIKNAWLEPCDRQEVDFFADCKHSELRYFEKNHQLKEEKLRPKNQPAADVIRKLIDTAPDGEAKKIRLPLDLEFHDPNENALRRQQVIVNLPGWQEVDVRFQQFLAFLNHDIWVGVAITFRRFDTRANTWLGNLTITYDTEETSGLTFQLPNVLVENVTETLVSTALEAALTSAGEDNIFRQYHQKLLQTLARLTEHHVRLRGLYDVLLEFDMDERFGELNSPWASYRLYLPPGADGELEELELDIRFPDWQEVLDELEAWHPFLESASITQVVFENEIGPTEKKWQADLVLQFDGQGSLPEVRLDGVVFEGIENAAQLAVVKANLQLLTEGSILGFLHGKWKSLLKITMAVQAKLHAHRNFCEDFKRLEKVGVNEVAICADVTVRPDADLEKTLAQVVFEIENYLSPPVPFHTLRELVDRKMPAEEIFNGPSLKHGFILSEEIEKTALGNGRTLYVSDIVNLLMDVPGVLAVQDVLLTKYDRWGKPELPSQRWCLHIGPRHKAQLNRRKSKFLFFKDRLPYVLAPGTGRYDRAMQELDRLFALADRAKLLQAELDFPLPEGIARDLKSYFPLREMLPRTYGTGDGDLPDSATEARKAKAKQLQAYLALFDQVLANYFAQLANLGNLFSAEEQVNASQKRTYYTQFLDEEKLGADLWLDNAVLKDAGELAGPNSLQRLVETEAAYLDRRNRFLDHLLARFAEQFTDYALLYESAAGLQSPAALIHDKEVFLQNYVRVSSRRGQGFDYKNEAELWDTDNVPGLQERVASLLGIDDASRRFLFCKTLRDGFESEQLGTNLNVIHLANAGGTRLLDGTGVYADDEIFYAQEALLEKMYDLENYLVFDEAGQFVFKIGDVETTIQPDPNTGDPVEVKTMSNPLAISTATFATEDDATAAAQQLFQEISQDEPLDGYCLHEGLHIVEHILLRPKFEYQDPFMEVCLDGDCKLCGNEDPYSFRATAVLPFWMERFLDEKMKVRQYVERLLRTEAPAHVHLKICWVDNRRLRHFELRYQRWLQENAKLFPDPATLSQRLHDLLDSMGKLRNVYPVGFLHDCDDSEQKQTIILGSSYLGQVDFGPERNPED